MPYTYQWVDRLLFPQVTQSESWSLTLQNETTLFFCLLNPDWGLFQLPEWLSQCGTYTAFRISVSYPWQGEPKNLSNRVCVGGVFLSMQRAWRKHEQMVPSDKTRWIKEGKIKGNERRSEMKDVFFQEHFIWWAVRRWPSTLLWLRSASRSRASNSCHHVSNAPLYRVVITAEASVLFELFQEVQPPQQPLRVD